jgi:hypothetical protein
MPPPPPRRTTDEKDAVAPMAPLRRVPADEMAIPDSAAISAAKVGLCRLNPG